MRGPYVAGRQWGIVREDYSEDGDAWASFPIDHAVARAYRWGEDVLGGICDRSGFLNFSVAVWTHGEDVKEHWWAVDGTPRTLNAVALRLTAGHDHLCQRLSHSGGPAARRTPVLCGQSYPSPK